MIKNPIINALLASLYIVTLVFLISLMMEKIKDENILVPMVMLSLLTLSVATMGYLFFYQPIMMYLEGQKREAASFFLKTLVVFAGVTMVLVSLLFYSNFL